LPDGRLDTSFDRDGKLTTTFGGKTGSPQPYAVVLQPDGKILVAGDVYSGAATRTDFALVRYNANGSLDLTFGQDGKVRTDFGVEHGQTNSVDGARSLALQFDGTIIVGGFSQYVNERGVLVRYDVNGSLDVTFGGDGRVSRSSAAYHGIAVQADGKIVGGGGYGSIDQFNLDGSPDALFGTEGRTLLYLGEQYPYINQVRDLVIQPWDGKILVAGSSESYDITRFALARLNPDGSFDTAEPPASSLPLADEQLQPEAEAAVWDWFVASTAGDDSKLTRRDHQGAGNRVDLLAAPTHEPGRVRGRQRAPAGVMAETSTAGARRSELAHAAKVDQIFGQTNDDRPDLWSGNWWNVRHDSTRLGSRRSR
jgi:uncharacterized delta-60 repeat protein